MKISVVTTVLNDAGGMHRLLESLVGQEPHYEVIVVDAGSTDGTPDVVKAAAKKMPVKLIQREGPRGMGFRVACEAAKGDVLSFIGADDEADDGWIAAVRKAFEKEGVDVVVGTNILKGDGPNVERIPWLVEGQDIAHAGCNTSYRRSVYEAVGGIDEHFITAEDMELNLRAVRAGYHIVEAPDAVVYRTVRARGGLLKQAYWNGYGRGQLRDKHGAVPGMKGGALRSLKRPWNTPRLIAGFFGYQAGRRRKQ